MMNELRELRKVDPAASVDINALSIDPIFEELFDDIVSNSSKEGPELMSPIVGRRPEQLRRRHRAFLASASASAIVVLAVSLSVVLDGNSKVGRLTTPFRAARALTPGLHFTSPGGTSGSWQLVANVTGTGWQLNTSGPPPSYLTCPTTSACYAIGGNYASAQGSAPLLSESFYVSKDFGETWSVLPMPKGFVSTTRLSCSSKLNCSLGGIIQSKTVFVTTSDGGHQWSTSPLKHLAGALVELNCSSATACHGILNFNVPQPGTPSAPQAQRETSNPPDESFVTTTDGGITWTTKRLAAGEAVADFTCYSSSNCIVMGTRGNTAHGLLATQLQRFDLNLSESIRDALNTPKEMIQLPQYPIPAAFKVKVAALPSLIAHYEQQVATLPIPSTDSGEVAKIMRDAAALIRDLNLNAVGKLPVNQWNTDGTALHKAQQSIIEKLNVHMFVRSTSDGGTTWTTGTLSVNSFAGASTLSCSSSSDCTAIADQYTTPILVVTSNAGVTWQTRAFPADIPGPTISGVTCSSAKNCWASGNEAVQMFIGKSESGSSPLILRTMDGGNTWTKVSLTIPANVPPLSGGAYSSVGPISCPTSNACLALGDSSLQGSTTTPVYRFVSKVP